MNRKYNAIFPSQSAEGLVRGVSYDINIYYKKFIIYTLRTHNGSIWMLIIQNVIRKKSWGDLYSEHCKIEQKEFALKPSGDLWAHFTDASSMCVSSYVSTKYLWCLNI